MKTKLTIGDTVRIKPHKIGCKDCIGSFFPEVTKKRVISSVEEIIENGRIAIKDYPFLLSPCMLEKVEGSTTTTKCKNKTDGGKDIFYKQAPPQPKECKCVQKQFRNEICLKCKLPLSKENLPTKPKECIHEWRNIFTPVIYGDKDNKFYCIHCLKIEYRKNPANV